MIDLFGLPLTSILLFVLAGVLIGHLLWYPDRAIQKEKVDGLESRYWKARGTARERKSRFLELQRENETLSDELDRLRSDHDTLLAKHNNADNHLAETRRELSAIRQERESADASLEAETRRNESLVEQMQEALELRYSAEQEQQQQARVITDLEQQVTTLQKTLKQSKIDLSRQTSDVQEQQQTIDQLLAESATATEQLRTELQTQLDEKTAALERTEQDLIDRCADLDRLRSEHDDVQEQLQQHQLQSRFWEAEQARLHEIIQQRDEMAADLQSAADSLGQQRELLEAREVDFELLKGELAHLRTELRDATELLDQNAETQRELLATIDQGDATISQLNEQLEHLESTRQQVSTLSTTLETRDQTIETLQQELSAQQEEVRVQQQSIAALEASTEAMEESNRECERLTAVVETLQSEAYEMTLQLQTMRELESTHQSLVNQHEATSTQIAELEKQLVEKDAFIERQNSDLRKLAEEIEVLEPLQEQFATATEEVTEHRLRFDRLQAERDQQVAEIDRLQLQAAQVPELQQEIQQLFNKLELNHEETAGAKSRVDELNRQLNDLRVLFDELETSESSLRTELESERNELDTMTRLRDEQALHNQNLMDRYEQTEQAAAAQAMAWEQERQSITVELQQSRDEVTRLHQEIDKQQQSVIAAKQELAEQGEQAKQAAAARETEWERERQSTEAELQQFRDDAKHLHHKIAEQKQSLSTLNQELAKRCGLHETATREALEWQQRVKNELGRQQKLDQHNQELQLRVTDLTEHLKRMRAELEDSLEANAQAHDQIRKLRRSRGALPDLDDDRRAA